MDDRIYQAEVHLQVALFEYFRAQGIDEDALLEEVVVACDEIERQLREI